jgi:hypothetical protein
MLAVGTWRGPLGQHYQGAGQAGAASAGIPAWRLGTMVAADDTGTPGTSLLDKKTQHIHQLVKLFGKYYCCPSLLFKLTG